jgi:hypothetical protein
LAAAHRTVWERCWSRGCREQHRITHLSWKVRGCRRSTRRWILSRSSCRLRERKSRTNGSVLLGVPAITRPSRAWRTPSSTATAGCNVLARALSRTSKGDWGEPGGAHLYGQGFKRVCSSRSGADDINVVKVSDNVSCGVCCGYTVKECLKREGEREGVERVLLPHADGGEDRGGFVWRPSEENSRRAAVRPGEKRKACGGVFLRCVKDCLARDTVIGVLAAQA